MEKAVITHVVNICDVLIISYPKGSPEKARITWNQAKVTSKNLPHRDLNQRFKANLEQWDLLANRPLVSGLGYR